MTWGWGWEGVFQGNLFTEHLCHRQHAVAKHTTRYTVRAPHGGPERDAFVPCPMVGLLALRMASFKGIPFSRGTFPILSKHPSFYKTWGIGPAFEKNDG